MLPDPVRGGAVDLAFDNGRVDDLAAIIDGT